MSLVVEPLRRVSYAKGTSEMEVYAEARGRNEVSDALFLYEFDPTITLGRRAKTEHILKTSEELESLGVVVTEAARGGDVTFHGPGQVVGYPVMKLEGPRKDVRKYVGFLEQVLIDTCASFGIEAQRISGLTGVWVGDRKIAAIGVRISRWVASHGWALNVRDVPGFSLIVPCGLHGRVVTSLEAEVGCAIEIGEVARRLSEEFRAAWMANV